MPKKKDRNSKRIIDKKWVNIFQDYDILNKIDSNGVFEISSKIINQYKEARLMTKFDYINSLPDIFFENNLSILPTNRGQYI
ncbi:type II restriction enzyme, partial [Salmonella enterica]|uniref:type II restriction enzyme n=2 Tax=Bacteria TaxID=2 RepID=UPI001C62C748